MVATITPQNNNEPKKRTASAEAVRFYMPISFSRLLFPLNTLRPISITFMTVSIYFELMTYRREIALRHKA